MLRRLITAAASGVDHAAASVLLGRSARSRRRSAAESLPHHERITALEEVRRVYHHDAHFTDVDAFFTPPGAVRFDESPPKEFDAGGVSRDISWASGYEPFGADVRERYLAHTHNQTSTARVYLHARPARAAVILIHGYMGGAFHVEQRVWPVRWMFERGLDVALAVLPFHGARAMPGRRRPAFPNSDPRITIEGFRQAMRDLRALVGYFRARGTEHVGVMGMSLGGYSSALLGTVEPGLAFVVPMIPLASIADAARSGGRFVGDAREREHQHSALEETFRVVSPLGRKPRIEPERVLILAASGDRITPIAHAHKLAAHFRARIEEFHGGHLLQFGRGDAFRAFGRHLGGLGLLSR